MTMRFILLSALLFCPLLSLAVQPLPSFEARYKVYGLGLYLGTGSITLFNSGQQRYRMHADIQPQGAAALLISDRIIEEVRGTWHAQGPRPLHYLHQRTGGKKNEHTDIRFDWQNKAIHALHDGKKRTLALEPRITDPLSVYLLAMWDLQRGHRADIYKLASRTRLKSYQVHYHGQETLDTALGKLTTVRLSQQRLDKNRTTTFWFAEKLGYIPVQVTQTKNNSEQLRLLIDALKR